MELVTIHETKTNSLGIFACRVLGLKLNNLVLLVRPCIKPECPDLGFRKLSDLALLGIAFKDERKLDDLDPLCLAALIKKFKEEELPETDELFSGHWFTEVARVTELEKYQKRFSSLVESRP